MPYYEHVFIARQDISPAQVEALTETLQKIVADNGGKNRKVRILGTSQPAIQDQQKTARVTTAFSTSTDRLRPSRSWSARKNSTKMSCGR